MHLDNVPHIPKAFSWNIASGHHATITVHGAIWFLSLNNLSSSNLIVQFNADAGCVFDLYGESSMEFQGRDVDLSSIKLSNSNSGGGTIAVDVLLSYCPDGGNGAAPTAVYV